MCTHILPHTCRCFQHWSPVRCRPITGALTLEIDISMYNYFYFCACQESALDIKLGVGELEEGVHGARGSWISEGQPTMGFLLEGREGVPRGTTCLWTSASWDSLRILAYEDRGCGGYLLSVYSEQGLGVSSGRLAAVGFPSRSWLLCFSSARGRRPSNHHPEAHRTARNSLSSHLPGVKDKLHFTGAPAAVPGASPFTTQGRVTSSPRSTRIQFLGSRSVRQGLELQGPGQGSRAYRAE